MCMLSMTKVFYSPLGSGFYPYTSVIVCRSRERTSRAVLPITHLTPRTLVQHESHRPQQLSTRPPPRARLARMSPSRLPSRARRRASATPRAAPLQAGRQGGPPQAQQARRLLGVAADTAATADTSAAAAAAPAADAALAVAHPRLRRAAAAAAGGRDGGAVAQQEGGRGGCGRSGLLRAGPMVRVSSFAQPLRWTAPPTTAKVFYREYG